MGVTPRTLERWAKEPSFLLVVNGLRNERLQLAADRADGLLAEALDVVAEGLRADVYADRLKAARLLLDRQGPLRQAAAGDLRLLELERALEAFGSLQEELGEGRSW